MAHERTPLCSLDSPRSELMSRIRGHGNKATELVLIRLFRAHRITNAEGCLALVSTAGEVAAEWSFGKVLEHWAHKHRRAVYVPSDCRKEPVRQYHYGHKVRLAQETDALRLLKALASGLVYYDPGIKLERASTPKPKHKERSQFRVASKNIVALYESVETVEV